MNLPLRAESLLTNDLDLLEVEPRRPADHRAGGPPPDWRTAKDVRLTVCRTLQAIGLKTVDSGDPFVGLALARRSPPDIVLCDYQMESETGIDALVALRANPLLADVPFILVSGLKDDQIRRRCMDLGADDFLPKPVSSEALISSVKARLRKHAVERQRVEETKSRLMTMLETTPDFIAMAASTGLMLEINRAGLALLGIATCDGLGELTMKDIRPDGVNTVSTGDALAEACRTGTWRGEGLFRRIDGGLVPVSQVIVAHQGAGGGVEFISTTARDITENRLRDENLRLLERALEAVGSGIIITDATAPDHPIIYCNLACEKITGYSRDELIGRNCRLLQGPDTGPEAVEHLRKSLESRDACRVVLKNYRKDGSAFWNELTLSPLMDEGGRLTNYIGVQNDVTAAKDAEDRLRRSEELFRVITDNAVDLIAIVDRQGRRIYNSPSYSSILGYSPEELQSKVGFDLVHPEDQMKVAKTAAESLTVGQGKVIEYRVRHRDGRWLTFESHGAVIRNPDGDIDGLLIVARDITERKNAELDRTLMELQLRQAQKLESIGHLAAGIAHEINTPTQFIGDNTRFLSEAFRDLSDLRRQFRRLLDANREGRVDGALVSGIEETILRIDLAYLESEIPSALQQTLDGVERVAKIVRAMKEFSHPGTEEKSMVDINRAIESTVTVARNAWKYVADLELRLDRSIPAIPCLPGDFNQVILNLVVNSAHAIADVVGENSGRKGRITITTVLGGDQVEIRISDTGGGIPDHIRDRIFDPFFTTKPVGQGTGQGLAIARSAIVDKHGGTLNYETCMGQGTTFILTLPASAHPDSEKTL
jgi:PAS domain S-box-containing protein